MAYLRRKSSSRAAFHARRIASVRRMKSARRGVVMRRRVVRRPVNRRSFVRRRVVRRAFRPRMSYRDYIGLGPLPRTARSMNMGAIHAYMRHPSDPGQWFGHPASPFVLPNFPFAPSSMAPALPSASSRAVKRPAGGGAASSAP